MSGRRGGRADGRSNRDAAKFGAVAKTFLLFTTVALETAGLEEPAQRAVASVPHPETEAAAGGPPRPQGHER